MFVFCSLNDTDTDSDSDRSPSLKRNLLVAGLNSDELNWAKRRRMESEKGTETGTAATNDH